VKLIFTKRAGKFDDLLIRRDDNSQETIHCPKQGIIPHDMVHYAVEKIISRKGFLTKIADGEIAQPRMAFEVDAEAIERLVEAIQAELWSGRVPFEEVVTLYQQSCHARSHPFFPVSEEDIQLIRQEVDALTAEWGTVPVQGSLILSLDTAV
jgi:hypothetical protein